MNNERLNKKKMAEIPVERKTGGGLPWWLPLLLLLLLLPLLYFAYRSCTPAPVANTNTNTNANRAVATTNANTGNAAAFNEQERIRQQNEQAQAALDKFYPNGTPQQVVDALNLSVINFATGSAEIPESDKPFLKKAAEVLKKAPADTRIEVDGHTDNTGEPAANDKLSEERATAVKNFLVSSGAPAGIFTTKGFGQNSPKASNDTVEGRFQNRRIEYKVATGGKGPEQVTGSNPGNANAAKANAVESGEVKPNGANSNVKTK